MLISESSCEVIVFCKVDSDSDSELMIFCMDKMMFLLGIGFVKKV